MFLLCIREKFHPKSEPFLPSFLQHAPEAMAELFNSHVATQCQ